MKTTLTYGEITALVNSGVLGISARTLGAGDRYNVFNFKSRLREAAEGYEKRDKELVRECGVEDAAEFDRRLRELRDKMDLTEKEAAELDGMNARLETIKEQRRQMMDDTVEMSVRPIGHEAWFALRDENAAVKGSDGKEHDLLPDWVESLLFGKFWTAPEDADSSDSGKPSETTE